MSNQKLLTSKDLYEMAQIKFENTLGAGDVRELMTHLGYQSKTCLRYDHTTTIVVDPDNRTPIEVDSKFSGSITPTRGHSIAKYGPIIVPFELIREIGNDYIVRFTGMRLDTFGLDPHSHSFNGTVELVRDIRRVSEQFFRV